LFEMWPRTRLFPLRHPVRIHFGAAIHPEDLSGMETQAITDLIRQRMEDCRLEAWRGLRRDLTY
jgi:1-acyl-sn-glycerol-3-phosphate acyltransferase